MPDDAMRATASDVESRESKCSEPAMDSVPADLLSADQNQPSEFRDGVLIGAYARVQFGQRQQTHLALQSIEGVGTFELTDPDRIGILVEAQSLDQAHQILTERVRPTQGVLGVWPVSVDALPPAEELPPAEAPAEAAASAADHRRHDANQADTNQNLGAQP